MSQKIHRIHIRKESLKFSAAHMTVFPDGTKERLHGHNYRTEISLELKSIDLAQMISFSYFKKIIKRLCDDWDEKVLIQQRCSWFTLTRQSDTEIEFLLCQKRYVLPRDEVVLLDLDNITSESLAEKMGSMFISQLEPEMLRNTIVEIEFKVEESAGQGASYLWRSSPAPFVTQHSV